MKLRWRHNGHDSISNHLPHHCLLNRLFRRRSKKTSKLRVSGICVGKSPASPLFTQPFIQTQIKENIKAPRYWPFVRGIHRGPVNSPHKWPVTRKMFPFDDVIMKITVTSHEHHDISNHQQFDCLFDSLFRLTAKKNTHQNSALLAHCEWKPPHQWITFTKNQ